MRLAHASPAASALIDGVRFWRRARDIGEPVQPLLASAYSIAGGAFLAPVIDGLLRLHEAAFRRRFDAGDPSDDDLTGDEERLLNLLDHDDESLSGIRPNLVGALRAALDSTRIVLRMVLAVPISLPSRAACS